MMGNIKAANCYLTCLKLNEITIEDEKEMSKKFNKYFCTVAKQLNSVILPSTVSPISYVDRNKHSFFLAPTSRNECK